jgi:hypothetical protein
MIQPGVIALFCIFSFGPLVAKLRIRSDRNLVSRVISPRGRYVQSFRSIDPAVTKRALLTDDDDRQHLIVRAKKSKIHGLLTGEVFLSKKGQTPRKYMDYQFGEVHYHENLFYTLKKCHISPIFREYVNGSQYVIDHI